MNILLWVLQVLAALLYGASSVMKVFMFDKVSKDVPSFGALPRNAWTALGILEHAQRPPDDYHSAAAWIAGNAQPGDTVVASGYLYLETIAQRPAIAFPPEQAQHPGWRAVAQSGSGLPPGAFLWIGERSAPELNLIRHARRIDPIYMNSRAIVVKVH